MPHTLDHPATISVCKKCGLGANEAPSHKLLSCGACRFVKYCSPECQKKDRKSHRSVCLAISDHDYSVLDLYNDRKYEEAKARATVYPREILACDMRYEEFLGETVVHKAAAFSNQFPLLQKFLALQPEAARRPTVRGLIPLHQAGVNKNLRGVKLLHEVYPEGIRSILGRGIHDGGTALHITVFYGEFHSSAKADELLQIVPFLVDKHPDALTHRNSCGLTPLDIAILRYSMLGAATDEKAMEVIQFKREKTSQLNGGTEAVQKAEIASAIANDKDEDGITPNKIEMISDRAQCSKEKAAKALTKHEGDIIGALLEANGVPC